MESHYADARVRLASYRNVVLAVWWDAPRVLQMQHYRKVLMLLRERHPEGIGGINTVVGGTPTFPADVRAESAKLTEDALLDFGLAHIMLMRGLAGTAVRAFLATMLLLGRSKQLTKVFDKEDLGVDWVAEQMASKDVECDKAAVMAALAEVHAMGPGTD
ncbi:MAG: hypothetical protein AAF799_13305 [Myxococcota bacterium]